jgi:tRNA-guanine family transglycosylase
MRVQGLIGADISMQLDQCVSWPAERDAAQKAMELSIRWGARSKARFGERENQALFGIQQGSTYEDLRRQSSDQLQEIGFDGYAIGGLAVGEGHDAMCRVLDYAPAQAKTPDPLTGWAGSGDTQQQLKLNFPSQEAAVAYAQKQGIAYTVIPTPPKTLKLQAYADNFR